MLKQSPIKTYNEILDIRRTLKAVQQLSWDINATEKRYPVDSLPDEELDDLLSVYENLRERLVNLSLQANGNEPF